MTDRADERRLRDAYKFLEGARKEGARLVAFAEDEASSAHILRRSADATMQGETPRGDELDDYSVLDMLEGATRVLCSLPDDPLDTAEAYIDRRIGELADRLEYEATVGLMDVDLDGVGPTLAAFDGWLKAQGTPEEERADALASGIMEEVAKRSAAANALVSEAMAASRKAPKIARRTASSSKAVRMAALLLVASFSWVVGFLSNNFTIPVQVLIAAVLFVVLDQVVVDRLLDPRLKKYRRGKLIATAQKVAEQFRSAEKAVLRVKSMAPPPVD